ncbi:MAG: hypothetical protein DMG60_14235 [Acidobacteria bacterium]|nr:MAG: hypothetical protein DMG60_14235 [Acidobacteriota bacterium]
MPAELLKINSSQPEQKLVSYAAERIRQGQVLGMPTDTFYGLAADPVNLRAALRVPSAPIPVAIIREIGFPITATSANLLGASECMTAECVRDQMGDRISIIVNGGPTERDQPTTIVDLSGDPTQWQIIREGAIPAEEISQILWH